MATDICNDLLSRYVPEKPLQVYKIISTSEKGIFYVANVVPEREAVVFQVDGCIITVGCKCDKLILSKNPTGANTWIGHFIELKGTDVAHAIEQLEASVRHDSFRDASLSKKHARIVANSFPSSRANPVIERARCKFRQQYHCELRTLKSRQPDTI